MLDLIAVILCTIHIGRIASKKGLSVLKWRISMVLAWVAFEVAGFILGLALIGRYNFIALNLFAVFCAFGGYLFIRFLLDRIPTPE